MISVVLYAVVFFQAKLYADMGLQALYFALAVYGWWAWLHGGEDHGELRVSLASRRMRWSLAASGLIAGVVLGQTLDRFTDASLPFMDSLLTSFSIIAQWMQTRKKLEAWLVWLAVDVFYVGMFLYKGLYPTAGLYAVFLYLALLGFMEWKRSMGQTVIPLQSGEVP
jgi:nicotinamide mononucleotide transporter